MRLAVLALLLSACNTAARAPAFRPRPPGRSMTTPSMLVIQNGQTKVLLGFGSSHASCDHREHVQQWVAVDLRTRHVRVLPSPQLAF